MTNHGENIQEMCLQHVNMCMVIPWQTPHTTVGNQYMQGATVKNTTMYAIRFEQSDAL